MAERPDDKKAKCQGGPYDGMKIRVLPDPTVTKQGKQWEFNDVVLMDGVYRISDHFKTEKTPTLYWEACT